MSCLRWRKWLINLPAAIEVRPHSRRGLQCGTRGGSLLRTNETPSVESIGAHEVAASSVRAQEAFVSQHLPSLLGELGGNASLRPTLYRLAELTLRTEQLRGRLVCTNQQGRERDCEKKRTVIHLRQLRHFAAV